MESDSTEKRLRRKDNRPVPSLKLLNKKRNNKENDDNDVNPDFALDP